MKLAIIVTSVINTSLINWNYAKRSFFNKDQRYLQTLETLSTIKNKNPDIDIYFIEGSEITEEMIFNIKSNVKELIFEDNIDNFKEINESPFKGHGEAIQTLKGIETINNSGIIYDYIFKISGRYSLSDSFDFNRFLNINPTFCQVNCTNNDVYSTVIYSIPYNRIQDWKKCLISYIDYCNLYKNDRTLSIPFYEKMFPPKLYPLNLIIKCGVQGYVAVDENIFYICK
jgi:hypothetical protein